MKTFKDLEFKPHYLSKYNSSLHEMYKNTKQAILTFPNGYGVSVLLGSCFYSNGKDTYEVMVTYKGESGEVKGYLTEQEVTELMIKTQNL